MNHYLVEIRLKDWEPDIRGVGRIISFEEVLANDEINARHAGFEQFERRCMYEPAMRLNIKRFGITQYNFCDPDAVIIDKNEAK